MRKGFTLAELLIALAILGVIAVFAIPKILQAQQDTKNKAIAKEAAGFISESYSRLQLSGGATSTTRINDLMPYLNYVKRDTVSIVDAPQTAGTRDCSSWPVCYRLHNGAMLVFSGESFAGTATTNGVWFEIDPDAKETVAGSTSGPGKAIPFWLYYNGKVIDFGNIPDNTTTSGSGPYNACPACIPPWFSWN